MSLKKIKDNSYVIFTLVFIITLVIIIFIVHNRTNAIVTELTIDRMVTAKQGFISYLDELELRVLQRAELIASRDKVIEAAEDGEYDVLGGILLEYLTGVDSISFCDPDGIMIFRSYDDSYGDNVSGQQNVAHVLRTGESKSSISIIPNGKIAACASVPVYNNSELLGIVNCNFDLTESGHLDSFKERTGYEATIFNGSLRISTTLFEDGIRLTGTNADTAIADRVLINGDTYIDVIEVFGGTYGVHYSPLISDGHKIGMLFTGVNIDSTHAGQRTMNFLIITASILGIVVAVSFWIVSTVFSRRYEKTVNELSEKMSTINILQKLHEADEYSQLLLDATPLSCTLWNSNHEIVNCNKEALHLFELNSLDDLNKHIHELSPVFQPGGEKSKDLVEMWLKAAFTLGYCKTEWMHQFKNGEELPCEITLVRVKHGEETLVASYTRDMRELNAYIAEVSEAREAAEAANKAKSLFMANMSKEIRGPMSNILGFAELAHERKVPKETGEYLSRISDNAKWMLRVIDDILDLYKVEAGRTSLEHASDSKPGEAVPQTELRRPHLRGDVLVCEDNEMNQMVLCEHLRRVGLTLVLAENGKEAVDIVTERERSGAKPFDLIFMDIHMPVMDGIIAASAINKLKTGTPIVAITANVMADEIELYKLNGMPDCISKPFTSQTLWKCLLRYFKQVDDSFEDDDDQASYEAKMLVQLRLNFVKDNQTTFDDIVQAVENRDFTLAHRLAHSLKSNAGQIGEKKLQETAAVLEDILADGQTIPDPDQLKLLEDDLNAVLDELAPLLIEKSNRQKTESISEQSITKLFDKLEVMLKNRNPECITLLSDIQMISGTEELAWFVEEFEFRKALTELLIIRERMDSNNAEQQG